MQIIKAEKLGFCYGVKRALDILEKSDRANITVLGDLIHNPQTIDKLKTAGVRFAESVEDINTKYALISAHGNSDKVKEQLKENGIEIVDATCPLVEKLHKNAKTFEKEGYHLLLLGDPHHVEVRSVKEDCRDMTIILPGTEPDIRDSKVALLSQTTQSLEEFKRMENILKKKHPNLKAVNTICNATRERQKAAVKTAKEVDLMIVIGGKHSANTCRLHELCSKETESIHIEIASEISDDILKGKENIGITAGASTPGWIIDEVIDRLKEHQHG